MKKMIFVATILILIVASPLVSMANDSTTEDFVLLASFAFVDYNQSVDMFYQNTGYHEVNPILGPSPSRQELVLFGAVGFCLSYALTEILPDAWRQLVVDSIIATERLNIEENRLVYKGWNTDGPPLRGRIMDGIPIVISMRF